MYTIYNIGKLKFWPYGLNRAATKFFLLLLTLCYCLLRKIIDLVCTFVKMQRFNRSRRKQLLEQLWIFFHDLKWRDIRFFAFYTYILFQTTYRSDSNRFLHDIIKNFEQVQIVNCVKKNVWIDQCFSFSRSFPFSFVYINLKLMREKKM